MLKLSYALPNGEVINTDIDTDMIGFGNWLQHMMSENNDVIFFFTTETTDIF